MPRSAKNTQNDALLQAALEGLELQRQKIEDQISQVRAMLGDNGRRRGRPPGKHTAVGNAAGTRNTGRKPLSAAARKRIAAAQKRRWAEYRKNASAGKEA